MFPVSCVAGGFVGGGGGSWERGRGNGERQNVRVRNDSLVISIKTAERYFPTLLFSTMVLLFCDCHQNPKARLLILLCCVLVF